MKKIFVDENDVELIAFDRQADLAILDVRTSYKPYVLVEGLHIVDGRYCYKAGKPFENITQAYASYIIKMEDAFKHGSKK